MIPPGTSADPPRAVVRVPTRLATLEAELVVPPRAFGVVLFAHGSGSSRHSPRNRAVAEVLQRAGLATLLLDLLTPVEERHEAHTGHLRFNIPMLAARLVDATDWITRQPVTRGLRVGYFGASTGGGAAIVAAASRPHVVAAVVSRGGRPDLAGDALTAVRAPTLLIVGSEDVQVLDMNRDAMERMCAEVEIDIVPGATHLFEEHGAMDHVARRAAGWFARHLARQPGAAASPR